MDQERKTRALRKQKVITIPEESCDSDSSDYYEPTKEIESDTSDDSDIVTKKKNQKKRKAHNGNKLGAKRKKSCKPPESLEDDISSDIIAEVKKEDQNIETNHNDTKQEATGKKSKGKGKLPLEKSTNQKRKKKKGSIKKRKGKRRRFLRKPIIDPDKPPKPPRTSVTSGWYIASGFMKDLTALFELFDKQNSWRYTAFATCWQKLKFSLVYRGRFNYKELMEFTEEILFWTKKFSSPLHSMKWRVGALYVLYGLYHKHPFKNVYKIKVDIEEYKNLLSLAGSFQSSAENPDPAYIFYKLHTNGVFYHVATSDEMGLALYPTKRQQDIVNYEMQWVLRDHSAITVLPERERNIQKILLQEYEKVKSQTWGNGNGLEKALSYVQSDMLSEVDTVLFGLQQEAHQQPATSSQAASTEISEIGQRKREIYKKAATLNTTDEFFKRKQLRSPQKSQINFPREDNESSCDSLNNESGRDDTSGEEDVFSDNDDGIKAVELKKIMEFMQTPEEETPDIPFVSVTMKCEQNDDYLSNGPDESLDSKNILLPNESPKQKPKKPKTLRKDENPIRLPQLMGRKDLVRESQSPKKAVQRKKSPLEKKTRSKSLLNQKKKISIGNASVSNKQKESLSDDMEKKLQDKQNRHENTPQLIYSVHYSKERLDKLNKQVPPNSIEGEVSSAGADEENSSPTLDKHLSEKESEQVCNGQVITSGNVCEKIRNHNANTSENVYEEALDDQTRKTICEKSLDDDSVTTTEGFPDVCNADTLRTSLESDQNDTSASHIINDMENTLNSSQENCSDMNHARKVLKVEILTSIPKKKSLLAVLKAENMVYLEICFKDDDVKVHSLKFKMLKNDLKTIENDKNKLESLKNKLRSVLPAKYKKYELIMQLTVLQSAIEGIETSEKKQCKQEFEPLPEPSPKDSFRHGTKSSCEHFQQGSEPTLVLPKASGTLTKTVDNIPHEKPSTSCIQHIKGSSPMTEDNHIASGVSPVTCDDINLVEKIIEVEMVPKVSKENHIQSIADNLACFDVNFQVEGVTIHHLDILITKEDLETIQNDEEKLESLKAQLHSLLPPYYHEYEVQLRLTVLQSVTEGNENTLEHSRQDYDSSASPHAKPSTSRSQNDLSNIIITNEMQRSHSKTSAPQVPQNVSNLEVIKECYSSEPAEQGQDNTRSTAQPTSTTSHLLPHQRTTESPVTSFISERSHQRESYDILKSNSEHCTYSPVSDTQNEPPEIFQIQNHVMKNMNEVAVSSPDYCSSQTPASIGNLSVEESSIIKTEYQIWPSEEGIIAPTNKETKLDIIHMDGRTITPNYEEISHSTASNKNCTNELDTENNLILWKTRSNSNTMNDKNLHTSLPPNDSSSGHFSEREGKALGKTVRMGGALSLNSNPGKSVASTSRNNDIIESARTGINSSKAKSNSVCSFYYFSKQSKCDLSKNKETRQKEDSRVKKSCVPFLFMENLITKKEQ